MTTYYHVTKSDHRQCTRCEEVTKEVGPTCLVQHDGPEVTDPPTHNGNIRCQKCTDKDFESED